MLSRKFVALAVLALAPFAVRAAEPDNPYKATEKGQWASYKVTAKVMGQSHEGTVKQTVVEKTDKSVTLEVTHEAMGQKRSQKQTIDLTKPFDPLAGSGIPAGQNVKMEKKESGKEKLEVGGKKVECDWVSMKMTTEQGGFKLEADVKYWTSKEVALGVAKMEMKSDFFEMSMVMDKSGKD